jgi:hypothetical protein
MIMRIVDIVAALYGEIGPGLLLAACLPFLLFALVMVARESIRRLTPENAEAGTHR